MGNRVNADSYKLMETINCVNRATIGKDKHDSFSVPLFSGDRGKSSNLYNNYKYLLYV